MNTMTAAHQLPRTAIRLGLSATRVPFAIAESLLARGAEDWPPMLAFEAIEGNVKRMVGGIIGDDVLVHEGELTGAKVARLRQASELETTAELRRTAAAEELEQRRAADEERRNRAEAQAEIRRTELERKEAAAKQRVDQAATAKKQTVRKATAASKSAVERKARRARRDTVTAERTVVAKERAAANRARAAKSADKRIDRSKAARSAKA